SPSGKGNGISRGQIIKIEEMLGHGIFKSTVFNSTPTVQVDKFIKKICPDLRDVWVKGLEKRFRDFLGCSRILVNYDEPDAIAKSIEEANFDFKQIGVAFSEIPLVGTGKILREVHEVCLNRVVNFNRDLLYELKRHGEELGFKGGFRLCDPLTALRFICAHPDKQRYYPIVTILADYENDSFLEFFFFGINGERDFRLWQGGPDGRWGSKVRFLAVCDEQP
ncbi:hypothetical protein HY797_01480, partial [Candidatus Falkowbacteria bacterium]|nr:hypothetical protein [Candidatus Falkowbacteria bacterium]